MRGEAKSLFERIAEHVFPIPDKDGRIELRLVDLVNDNNKIHNKCFRSTDLIGPAVVRFDFPTCYFHNCTMGGKSLEQFWEIAPETVGYVGGIYMSGCTFYDCTFYGIGFLVTPSEKQQFLNDFAKTAEWQV